MRSKLSSGSLPGFGEGFYYENSMLFVGDCWLSAVNFKFSVRDSRLFDLPLLAATFALPVASAFAPLCFEESPVFPKAVSC